jgi:hypothetical protein
MTHDMVHRSHLYIFDTYYPRVFSSWLVSASSALTPPPNADERNPNMS